MKHLFIALLAVFVLFSSQAVFACSCSFPDDLSKSFRQADAVFIGEVLNVEMVKYVYAVTMHVKQAYKGVEPGQIMIYTNIASISCGYKFVVGETYFVFAEKNSSITEMKGGKLSVSKCSRTRPLAEAGDDIPDIY